MIPESFACYKYAGTSEIPLIIDQPFGAGLRPDLHPEALEQKEIIVHRTDTDVMDQWQLVRTDTDAMVQCQFVMSVDSHVLYYIPLGCSREEQLCRC